MGRKNGVVPVRRTAAQWESLVARQAAGSLTQRAFCARHGVAYASFCHWKRRLREEGAGADERRGFVQLQAPVSNRTEWDVELTLGEGVVLRVRRR
jgi:putative transposase